MNAQVEAIACSGRTFRPHEKVGLVLEILRCYATVRWSLWRRGLPDAVAAARSVVPTGKQLESYPLGAVAGKRLARAVVRTLSVLPTDSRCLVRSLVLIALLSRRGLQSSLVIGVRSSPRFSAHAWVEHDGVPLLPGSNGVFERLVDV